ncbi:MAG: D-alanyl-D-alanine carboxypeptidase family protein [Burkholderiales bacterium]
MMKLLTALLTLIVSANLAAQSPAPPGPPTLASKAYLLVDFQSREVLAARNADARTEPASLTKLMTAYVAFDALRQKRVAPSQITTVSAGAARAPGSRMFLSEGEKVDIEALLRGMIVQSGNDASVALAEAIAGSEEAYVQIMNHEAARLGLKQSHFVNVTGLQHPQHYSTATDLVALSAALIDEFPQYFPLYSLREYRHNGISQKNRNLLLERDPFVDGMKTGWTHSAGYCLVGTARRKDRRVIAAVMNAGSENGRIVEAQKLLNFGLEAFDTFRVYGRGQVIHHFPVWKGSREVLSAGLTDDYYVTVSKGPADRLKASMESMQPLVAPIRTGDRVGTLKLALEGKPFGERPVVALENVGIANLFVRGWHSLRLLIE